MRETFQPTPDSVVSVVHPNLQFSKDLPIMKALLDEKVITTEEFRAWFKSWINPKIIMSSKETA